MEKLNNIKIGKTNVINCDKNLTVKGLKKILKQLDNDTLIEFGIYNKKTNCTSFTQDDDLIFRLTYKNRHDEYNGRYTMEILTDYDLDFFTKKLK